MSLLPVSASYLEHVATIFLSLRGDGVALSPNDAELLLEWQRRGVPYEVVLRGIGRAVRAQARDARPGAGVRTLRSCRMEVEREYRRWQGLSAGATAAVAAEPPGEERGRDFAAKRLEKARALLEKALAAAPSPAHARALRAAVRILEARAADPREASRAVARAEDALALRFVRGLPFDERRALVREAREQAGPWAEGASARGRKDALRTHLVALARARGDLVSIV